MPHKIAVMGLLDEVSPAARRAGAVNTIVNRGGSLFGDNTDIHGFGVTVSEALAGRSPAAALVLGAGGAARAVVLALEAAGVAEIVVANRDRRRAAQLARDLEPAPVRAVALDATRWPRSCRGPGCWSMPPRWGGTREKRRSKRRSSTVCRPMRSLPT